jgi:UDPglucose--hexose-1-phosphate uridylyltransferase
VDTDFMRSLAMAKKYFKTNNKCIYCEMNKWDLKEKVRIVFENEDFMTVCPFASKTAFETIISPKKHVSYFEQISDGMKWNLAEAFRVTLAKIQKGLDDPSFNFYLHTSPADGKKHPYYHWHWTIFPKTGIPAGFEIGTKMEISSIEPEAAAAYLREQNV